jgi:signal transduction histidine kinase
VDILIVEDSPTQALHLQYILEQHHYRVSVATNGRDALADMRQRRPTIVISDIIMPEMDGYQLCQHIKADANLADIPVILLTSLSDPKDVIRGLECGADNFIMKPYDEDFLLSRIQHILANQRDRRVEGTHKGLEIFFAGQTYVITADRLQILNLLLSTYETAVQKNRQLIEAQEGLQQLNAHLEKIVAELRDINAELESFSYSVAHDLRAPLRSIQGFAQILLEEYIDRMDSVGQNYVRRIMAATRRMDLLTEDLLTYSRLSRAAFEPIPASLEQVVDEALMQLEAEIRAKQADVVVERPLPQVIGQYSTLVQVVANLLANGIKFVASGVQPSVRLWTEERDDWVRLSVRDNGIGIAPEYQERIFRVFERLHGPDTYPGTGIGLSIVRKAIERMGGRVGVESTPDGGSTFWVELRRPPRPDDA